MLPKRALTNIDILNFGKNIKDFRGVFMRDNLPKKIKSKECGIVNLDSAKNIGSHWVAYIKKGNYAEYFDSFGNLRPPKELIKYLNTENIVYNYSRFQKFNSVNCGHLCIQFLLNSEN